jgi:hypothetical protein
VVTVGDVVQGFRITQLSLDAVELTSIGEPWPNKKITIDVRPPPKGIRYVKASELMWYRERRGRREPLPGASPSARTVTVIPPMSGEPAPGPVTAQPPAQALPSPAAAGAAVDDRPWWKRMLGEPGARASAAPPPAPSPSPAAWWSGFGRPSFEPHPLEDRPRSSGK